MNVTNKNNKDKIKRTYISLATLGNSNVGKTNIINNFLGLQFSEKNLTTIGIDFKIKNVILENNSKLKVKIWDTAGQERFRSMAFSFLKNIQGILLIYDLTDKSSFLSIDKWISNLENNLDMKNVPIILVGNKNDKEDERKVSYEEGLKYAQKYNFKFFEMSAKTGENVKEAFLALIHLYYDKNKEEFILENEKENTKENTKEEEKNDTKNSNKKVVKKGKCFF
jgi:small GTP-binding protein